MLVEWFTHPVRDLYNDVMSNEIFVVKKWAGYNLLMPFSKNYLRYSLAMLNMHEILEAVIEIYWSLDHYSGYSHKIMQMQNISLKFVLLYAYTYIHIAIQTYK